MGVGELAEAAELLAAMRGLGMPPDLRAYNILLKGASRGGDLAALDRLLASLRSEVRLSRCCRLQVVRAPGIPPLGGAPLIRRTPQPLRRAHGAASASWADGALLAALRFPSCAAEETAGMSTEETAGMSTARIPAAALSVPRACCRGQGLQG